MKKRTLPVIIAISSFSVLLFLFGLGWAVKDQLVDTHSELQPSTKETAGNTEPSAKKDNKITVAAIGDSLTRGTGDDNGKGYVGYLIEQLKKKSGSSIAVANSAIKGERSEGLVEQLKQPQIQRQIANADVIVMTIGGNDLFRGGEALQSLDTNSIEDSRIQYIKNLEIIYGAIRKQNPKAEVFHVGLYNPFINMQESELTTAIVRDWNFAAAESAAKFEKVVYIPTFDLFQLRAEDYLYSDQFHPNAEGYKLIAERVASLITVQEEGKTK
ncbi:SGNH/GDSL hydrolase family protein [Fictibacillus aquaticus]|uniref:GDSL family lipase n=1 Tax=Fictibacillus aquaticus TaxID=2021314 RepID=A0A235FF52_9BACL|nr:SGNH/GDSL hydrolase family protein [Fictibacillus aquaticus]OYD59623.1 GDSL family lipase [Fictibacillus aquaticus]